MSLKADFSWQGILWQGLNLGLGSVLLFLLWVLAGRNLGPEGFGWLNYFYSFSAVAALIMDFGLEVYLARLSVYTRVFPSSLLRIKIWISVIVFLFLFAFSFAYPSYQIVFLFFAFGAVLFSATSFLNGALRGIEKLSIEGALGLLQKIVFFLGTVSGFYLISATLYPFALSYFISHILCFLLTFYFFRCLGFSFRKDGTMLGDFQASFWLWLTIFVPFFFYRLDFWLLKWFLGTKVLGLYAAGFRVFEGLCLLGPIFKWAIFPSLVRSKGKNVFRKSLAQSLVITGGLTFCLVLILFLFLPFLFSFAYGPSFKQALPWARFLLILSVFGVIQEIVSLACVALNLEKIYVKILLIAGFLALSIEIISLPLLKIFAVNICVAIRLTLVLIFSFFLLNKYVKNVI